MKKNKWETELKWWTQTYTHTKNGLTRLLVCTNLYILKIKLWKGLYTTQRKKISQSARYSPYLHSWAPQCHVVSMWLREVLCMRVCMDMVAGMCVSMVCVHHCWLWRVQGTGHWGEGVRPGVSCHLRKTGEERNTLLLVTLSLFISSCL